MLTTAYAELVSTLSTPRYERTHQQYCRDKGNTVPEDEQPTTDVKTRSTRKTKTEERRILPRHKCEYITKVNSNNRTVRGKRLRWVISAGEMTEEISLFTAVI